MKFIDMTGWIMKEHGVPDSKIIVLYRDTEKSGKLVKWVCQCECGNIFSAVGAKIRNGWTRSCGCLQKEVTSNRTRADLTGQQFGYLTAIKPIGTYGHTVLWECKCKCGNIKQATSSNLLSGQTRSCGCMKSYGEVLVRQYLENHNIKYKTEYNLGDLRGIAKSCARIDFAILKDDEVIGFIEVDGIQHYDKSNPWYNQGVEENSKLKEQYSIDNNISLLHLFYNQGQINFKELECFLKKLEEIK